jgi:hypothetical protein
VYNGRTRKKLILTKLTNALTRPADPLPDGDHQHGKQEERREISQRQEVPQEP